MQEIFKNSENVSKFIISNLALKGRTQKWLADECGVSPATISFIVNNKRKPSRKLNFLIELTFKKEGTCNK